MSLDGYVAGPDQSVENPLGVGGMRLHEWAFALEAWRAPHGQEGGAVNASNAVVEESMANIGATVMGRVGAVDVAGKDVGLFTDMRENRHWMEPHWRGRSVLNLYAHTGLFSVAAAMSGAASVTTVV